MIVHSQVNHGGSLVGEVMKGARKLPQFNLRWPQESLNLAKQIAAENGRSVNEELHRMFVQKMKEEGRCVA
ncbi:TPA: Arc family DNA-binding protein [Salmonella enterica subsp. enterica serovar Brunei]